MILRRLIEILLVTILCSSCANAEDNASSNRFERLCDLYAEVLGGKPKPTVEQAYILAQKIESELPSLGDSFENWALLPTDEVYPLIKEKAEAELGTTWDCPAIIDFYRPENDKHGLTRIRSMDAG